MPRALYAFSLREFLPSKPYYFANITPQIIESYKAVHFKSRKRNTVNAEISAVRRFFNLAMKFGYVDKNPCKTIAMLKVSGSCLPRGLTNKELDRIYEASNPLDVPVLRFLANTGMRWGEVRHLE